MRLLTGIVLAAAISIAGCGGNKSGGAANGGSANGGSGKIVEGKGSIVKPEVVPEVPPAPEEESLAGLDTGQLLGELGKPHARLVASKLLAAKGAEVVPELITALAHEDWQVRAGAIFTLGRLGKTAEPALPELKKLLETEPNETVKDSIPYCIDAIEGR